MTFSDVIEVVKRLSTDEKHEIQLLLAQYLREERRDEIYANLQSAQLEYQNNQLTFSSDIQNLRQIMGE